DRAAPARGREPQDRPARRRPRVPGRAGRVLCDRARRDLWARRRVGLRQEHHGPGPDRAPAPSAGHRARHENPARGPRDPKPAPGRTAETARQSDLDDLSGADDGPEPALAGRASDRRDVRAAPGRDLARGRAQGGGGAGQRARAGAGPAREGLSAPALGRDAPARDDRHRAGLRPEPPHRGRADDRARRYGAGRNSRPHPRPLRRARHRGHDDQPRSRAHRQYVPARRGDVCRAARGTARGGRRVSRPEPPLHERARRLAAAARRARAPRPPQAEGDRGRGAFGRRFSAGLPLQPALRAEDLDLRRRGSRPDAAAGRRRGEVPPPWL
ncbi:MAG: Oligopeptide transport ATP-binding protein OppD, partial [uncultured Microvirga sp.]